MTDTRGIFIKNWIIQAPVGVYGHEKQAPQRLRVSLKLEEIAPQTPHGLNDVVDYGALKTALHALIIKEHTELLEVLADRIAAHCLTDQRVSAVSIKLEKLDIFPDCESCGVRLTRRR